MSFILGPNNIVSGLTEPSTTHGLCSQHSQFIDRKTKAQISHVTGPWSPGPGGHDPQTRDLTLPLAFRWEKVRLRLPGHCAPLPLAPRHPGNARQRGTARREGPEGLGAVGATAAGKSSPAGGLECIWLSLHPRNKGGCRRLYLVGRGGRGQEQAAPSPVGDLGIREEGTLGPDQKLAPIPTP